MKSIAAHFVYIGSGVMLSKHVVSLEEDGRIHSIKPLLVESASTIFYNGIICPAFGLPGDSKCLNPKEATDLLHRLWNENPELKLGEILNFYTSFSELKVGFKTTLWCIDKVDLKELIVLENTIVYSVTT